MLDFSKNCGWKCAGFALLMLTALIWIKFSTRDEVGGFGADRVLVTGETTRLDESWFVGCDHEAGIAGPLIARQRMMARVVGDETLLIPSSQAPPPSSYGELETLLEEKRTDPITGVIEQVRMVRADFKYPLLRVEETLIVDESGDAPETVLLGRRVMVADHVLVSDPGEALRGLEHYKVLGEVAPGSGAWRVSIPAENPEDLPRALAVLGEFADVAEPDYLVFHQQVVPDDPDFTDLWGMQNTGQTGGTPGADISATAAWQYETGGGEVIVAVIDSGVDYLHPDLAANIWQNESEVLDGNDVDGNGYVDDVRGWDFYGNDNDPMDDHFHGTHVAGTVGARGNNSLGVTGVIWNVKIMPLKFMSPSGGGATSDAIAAVRYSADNGARISCNSWGGGGYSKLLEDAIRYAGDMNSLFVAAAGNSANNNDALPSYPCSYQLDNIISVAATDHEDHIAWFSNYGSTSVDVAAPGVGITSTFPRSITGAMAEYGLPANYARISGTSMATPHVAGAAALLLDSDPSQTTSQLRNRILYRADFVPDLTGLVSTSARLNVANLVDPSWVPAPAQPVFGELEWQEVSGHADGDGTVGVGEQIEFTAGITNQGGIAANDVVLSAEVVSGPATLISPAQESLGTFEAYAGVPSRTLATIEVDDLAQDLDEIVLRFTLAWQGGEPINNEITLTVADLTDVQATVELDFSVGEMIRGPQENSVFMISPSAWRVIEFDTQAGEVVRYADLDISVLGNEGTTRSTGGMATNQEGTLLYAALTGTRQIQVFSLPELAPLLTLDVDHQPFSLAVDAEGSLFTTSMDYWGPLREVDVNDGHTIAKGYPGKNVYKGALLKTDSARQRLFLAETGMRAVGGPGYVFQWDVDGGNFDQLEKYPHVMVFLRDFTVDEQSNQLLTVQGGISLHGGTYGVQVTDMSTGAYGEYWPFRSPYGSAVDRLPASDFVYAGSGAANNGVIRRFRRSVGTDLGAFNVQPSGTNASLLDRGLLTTANGRVLYVSTEFVATPSSIPSVGGYRYFLNLTGQDQIDVSLPPLPILPARPVLAKVELSDLAGNDDLIANPGELVHLAPHVRNVGGATMESGVLEIESLQEEVVVMGSSSWSIPAIDSKTTLILPQTAVQIGEGVPDDTEVDFLFRLTLSGGAVHEFRHRFTVRPAQQPVSTSPFTHTNLQFSGLAASPNLNEVYLIDSRNLRVIALDTSYGMIRKIVDIPVQEPTKNGRLIKLGEPAVSVDGSLLAVAGKQTKHVYVFSLPELEFQVSHATSFEPTHVSFDSMNRLHMTGDNPASGTSLQILRMDALSGEGLVQYGQDLAGSPLRASHDGTLMGRREGGSLKIYDGAAGSAPALMHDIPLSGNSLHDFEIDPASGKAYLIVGDGKVSVRDLDTGLETDSWELNVPYWGSAVQLCPSGELVAASDYWYGGGTRRYSATGENLQDVVLTDQNDHTGGNAGSVVPRGLAVTPNGRVVFLARAWVGATGLSVDGYDYTVGILGFPINLTEPGPNPIGLTGLQLLDPPPGNNNGYAEPGETITLVPSLQNTSFNLLQNLSLSLVSTNPQVEPVAPLSATAMALNSGAEFTPSVGLAVEIGSSVEDGESLGLSLQITYESGSQLIPLDIFAMKVERADAEIVYKPGTLLADNRRNVVYVTDTTENRVLSIETSSGTILAAGRLAGTVRNNNYYGNMGNGGLALSADGSLLAVALFESSQIQILSADTLASVDVVELDFKPLQVAFGANGRLYVTDGEPLAPLREINPLTGKVVTVGAKTYRMSQLKMSVDHRYLYVFELISGGAGVPIDVYLVEEDTPLAAERAYAYAPINTPSEVVLEEETRTIFVAIAGRDGLQKTDIGLGVNEAVWPPRREDYHGIACARHQRSQFIYGGYSTSNSHIRRFDRNSGRAIADIPIAVPGVTNMYFYLIDRGIAVTPNRRILFATGNSSVSSQSYRHFLSLIGGTSLNMTEPLARPKVYAGADLEIALSKPLTMSAVVDPPPGAATPILSWSRISGPGAVLFSGNEATTTANFSAIGRYQLQFSASVDGVVSKDTVWVDVVADDPWINVSAISSKAIRLSGLHGGFVIMREGDVSSAVTVQLSQGGTAVAGTDYVALPESVVLPSGVRSLEIPLTLLAQAEGKRVDLSVMQGEGYDPGVASEASVTIVSPSLPNWLEAAGEARPDLDLSALGNADGDALNNLMEYLLGRDPLTPSFDSPLSLSREIDPPAVIWTYRAVKNPIGAELLLEFSANLNAWGADWSGEPAYSIQSRTDHGDGTETIKVALSASAAAQPSVFLRLKGQEMEAPAPAVSVSK